MISAKSDKPTKDGRSQENYKKQNTTREKPSSQMWMAHVE